MENLDKHKKEFERIVKKYNMFEEQKAQDIANYLTKNKKNKISAKEFSRLFTIDEKDAIIFLSFIFKGITFKEKHLDKKDKDR